MARGPRRRVERGIYADRSGYAAQVTVARQTVEKRFPPNATRDEMRRWRRDLERALRAVAPASRVRTFAKDVDAYLHDVAHLTSWKELRAELRAWTARVGHLARHQITVAHVHEARAAWLAAGRAPKTVNHRCDALRRLWRHFDGRRTLTPVDDLTPLPVAPTRKQPVSAATLRAVAHTLRAREAAGLLRSARTRARFLVLATTGARPCEVMRARPTDLVLGETSRYWLVRDAKGGRRMSALPLNADMAAAWALFVAADAWGRYETSAFARTLRAAGWPAGVRPYDLRATVGMELSSRGTDLADVAGWLGHLELATTRAHYVPLIDARMAQASARLEGRLALPSGTTDSE